MSAEETALRKAMLIHKYRLGAPVDILHEMVVGDLVEQGAPYADAVREADDAVAFAVRDVFNEAMRHPDALAWG